MQPEKMSPSKTVAALEAAVVEAEKVMTPEVKGFTATLRTALEAFNALPEKAPFEAFAQQAQAILDGGSGVDEEFGSTLVKRVNGFLMADMIDSDEKVAEAQALVNRWDALWAEPEKPKRTRKAKAESEDVERPPDFGFNIVATSTRDPEFKAESAGRWGNLRWAITVHHRKSVGDDHAKLPEATVQALKDVKEKLAESTGPCAFIAGEYTIARAA